MTDPLSGEANVGHPETYYAVTWRQEGRNHRREFFTWGEADDFCDDIEASATHVQIEQKQRMWMGGGD